nr:DNA-binding protein [uncultured Massilia sp.]
MIVTRATSLKLASVPETLTTAEAAVALNRKPQTLRMWACNENGPIRPVRVHGRLAWPANQIAALLNGGAHA